MHPAVDDGHSSGEDRQFRERLRKRVGERARIEAPVKEEDNVGRQVRHDGVTDVAANIEPLCLDWANQLS